MSSGSLVAVSLWHHCVKRYEVLGMEPWKHAGNIKLLLIGPYDPHCGEYTFLAPPLGVWRIAGSLRAHGIETPRLRSELLRLWSRRDPRVDSALGQLGSHRPLHDGHDTALRPLARASRSARGTGRLSGRGRHGGDIQARARIRARSPIRSHRSRRRREAAAGDRRAAQGPRHDSMASPARPCAPTMVRSSGSASPL